MAVLQEGWLALFVLDPDAYHARTRRASRPALRPLLPLGPWRLESRRFGAVSAARPWRTYGIALALKTDGLDQTACINRHS